MNTNITKFYIFETNFLSKQTTIEIEVTSITKANKRLNPVNINMLIISH